jgi:tRNA(Arg) A34 adenosine deaminase TadA
MTKRFSQLKKRLKIFGKVSIDQLVKQVLLRTLDQLKVFAIKHPKCKRMSVGSVVLEINYKDNLITHHRIAVNGPTGRNKCSGIRGRCGCGHAEMKALSSYLRVVRRNGTRGLTFLLTTYTPCTSCANLIVESGVIDVVLYEANCGGGNTILDTSLHFWSKQQIEEDTEGELLKNIFFWNQVND